MSTEEVAGSDGSQEEYHVLVLSADSSERSSVCSSVQSQLPEVSVTSSGSLQECKETLQSRVFDLVIIDHDLGKSNGNGNGVEFIHELRLGENEPAVLVISSDDDSSMLEALLNLRCHRYILKRGLWLDEVGPAARQAMRLRKLEEENSRLLVRLTEANKLLEERNRRLDEFSGVVAHDIRGVLGSISMRLECLLDVCPSKLTEKELKLLSGAYAASRRVTSIVRETYNFARLGAKAAQMRSLDLNQLVSNVIQDLSLETEASICVKLQKLPEVWGNYELLSRVFINLLNNAVKYNDKDQRQITVGLGEEFRTEVGRFVSVHVEDNGVGIPEDELSKIFSMFWRSQETENLGEGLGIGLAVVQRIMEIHHGGISVESAPGAGTKIILMLPTEELKLTEQS